MQACPSRRPRPGLGRGPLVEALPCMPAGYSVTRLVQRHAGVTRMRPLTWTGGEPVARQRARRVRRRGPEKRTVARARHRAPARPYYDSHANRTELRRRGITPRIARRGIESSTRLGRHRWRVERALSWPGLLQAAAAAVGPRLVVRVRPAGLCDRLLQPAPPSQRYDHLLAHRSKSAQPEARSMGLRSRYRRSSHQPGRSWWMPVSETNSSTTGSPR
jgi:hypothetical protein